PLLSSCRRRRPKHPNGVGPVSPRRDVHPAREWFLSRRRCVMFGLMPWRKEKARGALMPREMDPFTRMERDFNALFNRVFGVVPMAYVEDWDRPIWNLEVVEEEKEYVVRAEAPGFEVADFDIRVTGELLTIVAEHKEAKDKGEKNGDRTHMRLE